MEKKNEIIKEDEQSAGISRMDFLKGVAIAALGGAALLTTKKYTTSPDVKAFEGKKKRYGMLIDLRKCVGCESCTIACKSENNVTVDSSGMNARRIFWNHLVYTEEGGEHPAIHARPQPCNHCENPPCIKACPVGATYEDESRGVVLINYDNCIGCRMCTVYCPYSRRYFNWEKPHFPHVERLDEKGMTASAGGFNPSVQVRTKGVTEKCTFCIHRIIAAEERAKKEWREVRDGEIQPACTATCIGGTRTFGDLNDPGSKISRLVKENKDKIMRLEEHLGTEPKVFFIKENI
ncbi:MAG: 4Fe-4S dicluster domain-containing protein [Planctomycetota bacterium]